MKSTQWFSSKNNTNHKCWWGCREKRLTHCSWVCKLVSTPTAMFLGWAPVASWLKEALQDKTDIFYTGFFQITASVLGLGACDILCAPFRSRISIYFSSLAFLTVSPVAIKVKYPAWLIFQYNPPDLGVWYKGQISWSLEKTSTVVIMLPFVGHLPRNMGPDYLESPLILPVLLCYFYSFNCKRFFSASLSVFLFNFCTSNICNFDVPMGGDEALPTLPSEPLLRHL